MVKPIIQKHPSGCAIACVAQVLGIKYDQALKLHKRGDEYARLRGFYCKEIVRILNKKGLNYSFHYVSKSQHKQIYQNGSIVFIARSKEHPQGHYLCRVKNRWMNPWINWPDITKARAGFTKRLPGRPIYVISSY